MDRLKLSGSHPDEQGFAKLEDARMKPQQGRWGQRIRAVLMATRCLKLQQPGLAGRLG